MNPGNIKAASRRPRFRLKGPRQYTSFVSLIHYRIYSNKRRDAYSVFHALSAALDQGRCLFEDAADLKIGRYKEIFSFNLTIYLPSVSKSTFSQKRLFIVPIHPFRHFSAVSSLNSDHHSPSTTTLFLKKGHLQRGCKLYL